MKKKYFGKYGGSFVSPEMQKELDLIESEFYRLIKDKKFNDELKNKGFEVQMGEFGADMKVNLVNDGPFTLVVEN